MANPIIINNLHEYYNVPEEDYELTLASFREPNWTLINKQNQQFVYDKSNLAFNKNVIKKMELAGYKLPQLIGEQNNIVNQIMTANVNWWIVFAVLGTFIMMTRK